jgi:hypothetical protein
MIRKKRINRDHAKKKNRPQVENEAVGAIRLAET